VAKFGTPEHDATRVPRGSSFTAAVPAHIRPALIALQSERLHAVLPLLCSTIAACAVAMTTAVLGDLPAWQQFLPPAIITATCLIVLARSRARGRPLTTAAMSKELQTTFVLASGLGLVAGIWSVNAFTETEKYYCMVAPVFIGIAALVSATCLISVPRAAIAGIVATSMPIVIKMALYDNLGVRAMAAVLVIVGALQGGVVLAKFRETVSMLLLQDELNRQAQSDSLTGLDNRLSFMAKLEQRIAEGRPILVALADLDGFKAINDTYGHQAGDAVLIEVGRRMRQLAVSAVSVARLGGDEFALLFDSPAKHAMDQINAIETAVPLPSDHGGTLLSVGMSIGTAVSPLDGTDGTALLAVADLRLYANKAARKFQHLRAAS
jgi:diguanylate cyclase